ncbi:hypothetical protein K3495_g11720 [Podosphaera aphanis]|nr:hypothetical protein K3495_g11720 [Podosphaera aphanis]
MSHDLRRVYVFTYIDREHGRERAAEVASSSKGKEVARDKTSQSADPSARKIAVPFSKSTAAMEAPVYPPDLHAVLEAEKRRAARIKAHLSICSTTINSVEAALSLLSTGENKSFVDGIKVYL